MKNILILVLLLSVAVSSFAADSVAIALKAKGDIELMRGDNTSKVNSGDGLMNQDELESKEEAFAVVKFIDGSSLIKLFPNSILTIDAKEEDGQLNKKSTLKMGTIWAKVSKKTGMFEVDTPNTVVSVKGTEFMVDVDLEGTTSVRVKEGEVKLKSKDTNEEKSVVPGEKGVVNKKGKISVARSADTNFTDPTRSSDDDSRGGSQTESGETEVMRIELKNADGEIQVIEIEFEDKR
ncbi:MAG: hypothetical protein DRH89_05230 [Candidatus Cloacimonadota bacterium]|nr:MAG: hypothetical protein DRI23_12260 [Candidatus Cloacimonadota bacterium]RLC56643.1 MAG: hypothetical protein DRH89_05230 [Candidatus Cloacimonadota bacterium]